MYNTREEWLNAAVNLIRMHLMSSAGVKVPSNTRVSCGLAGGRIGAKRIGECWSVVASSDGSTEIFISPVLQDVDSRQGVLATLVHECIHAAVGVEHGHKKPFQVAAKAAGLTGKMTATFAGAELGNIIETWSGVLGPYPHSALNPSARRKQTTRLIKCECQKCGFVFRTTQKWVDKMPIGMQCVDVACSGNVTIAGQEDASED